MSGSAEFPQWPLWHYHLDVDHFAAMAASFLRQAATHGALVVLGLHGDLRVVAAAEARRASVRTVCLPEGIVVDTLGSWWTELMLGVDPGRTPAWWIGDSGSPTIPVPALCPTIHTLLPPDGVALCCAGPTTYSQPPESWPPVPWPGGHRYYETDGPLSYGRDSEQGRNRRGQECL
jgi:hypothetical protein